MFESSKTVKTIFYINVIFFILTQFYPAIMFGCFAMIDPIYLYTLVTYQFMHDGFMHILFNMIVFLSIGPLVENIYGSRMMWIYYLTCGIFGALLQHFMSPGIPIVGASASIWGIMTIYTLSYPNSSLYLFFIPIPIKAKYLISVIFGMELISAIIGGHDGIGHWAHVGGATAGILIFLSNKYKQVK